MSKKVFINPNNNKNRAGFLLIDIILGLTLFTTTVYYVCQIAMNIAFLLQTFLNNSQNYYLGLFIAESLANGMSYDTFLKKDTDLLKNYDLKIQKVEYRMCNNHKNSFEVVIVKNEAVDKMSEYICYVIKER